MLRLFVILALITLAAWAVGYAVSSHGAPLGSAWWFGALCTAGLTLVLIARDDKPP